MIGFEELIRCKVRLPPFLVVCFTCGMHNHVIVYLVFTTRFEMLSVFIVTGQEDLTLCVVHNYEHCKGFGDTSELAVNVMETYFTNQQICN